jgi:hypothetical protein
MMTSQRIVNCITAEPFKPFRISMASGRTFEIRHPEMVQVGKTTMTIFTSMSDDPVESAQRQHEVSVILIESIEPLDARSAAGNTSK